MNGQNSTRALVEAALLTGVTVILILMTLYVPLFVAVGIFIWPLALIYIRDGGKYSIMSLVIAGIITAMISDPVTAFGLMLTYGISGILLGLCIDRKKTSTFTIIAMTAVTFIAMAVSIKVLSIIAGQDIIAQMMTTMSQSLESATKLYSSIGMPEETIKQFKTMFDVNSFKMILPSGLFFAAFMVSIFTYSFAKFIFKRFGYEVKPVKAFSEWYIPISIAFAVITLVLASYALSYFKIVKTQIYLVNSIMLLRIVFSVTGLSVIDFFLKKKDVSKAVRILIYFFLVTTSLSQILFFVGIIDYALDIRKLDPLRKKYIK